MNHALKNQLKIVPLLWLFHIGAVVLSGNYLPFVLFLERAGLNGFSSFSGMLVFLFSILAFALNSIFGTRFHSDAGMNSLRSIAVSIVIANFAFWTMTVPLLLVLLALGLTGT